MTVRRAIAIAALLALVPPALTRSPAAGATPAYRAVHDIRQDLLQVPPEALLPQAGHVRFVRVSTDGTLIFAGLSDGGLERSVDGGRTWQDLRVGVAGGPGAQTLDLRIAPSDPRIVWSAGLTGVFRSTDGGLTWSEVDTRSDAPGRALGSVLAIDPRHPEAAYLAGYRNGGLYRTGDGGLSWQEVLAYPVSGVAIDPANGAIIYAISRTAGLQRSIDHGHTWSKGVYLPSYTGVGEEAAEPGRLLAAEGPGGGLFAAMDGGGVQRSTDGGRTWQDLSATLPHSTPGQGYAVPYDLSVTGGPQPQLYTIVPDGSIGNPSGSALYAAPLVTPTTAATTTATATATATATTTAPISSATPIAATTPISISVVASGTATASSTPSATSTASLTSTATATPVPALQWQQVASNVDAVTALLGARPILIVAREAPISSGAAATVGVLNGANLFSVPYRLPPPLARVTNDGFAYGNTPLPYLSGINYEGPNDRPWQLWQDGKFDPTLVARDLDAAAAAGYRVLRVFVQDPLPTQILQGEFGHLDTLVTLAHQRDQRLLITFNDSRDYDLGRVAAVDRAIAAHLRGNPTVFGYDLQNEPGFQDIVAVRYPTGVGIPLQSAALVRRYGEYVSLKRIRAERAAGKWMDAPFSHMSADQVWVYLNVANILDQFYNANPGFPDTPATAKWAPLVAALNQSLATYIAVQMGAVRSVDRQHPITIGYNSYFWSSFPANEALDFRSIHLYPTTQSFSSIHAALRLFETLRGLAHTPLVLGEYGFSTAFQSGSVASVQETAMSLYLRVLGGEGDIKWVLNDDTVGYNPYENGLGLFGAHGVPKSGFYVNRALSAYFGGPHQPGGVRMWSDGSTGIGYLYTAPDALGVSGGSYAEPRLHYQAHDNAASAQLWLDWTLPGRLRLVSTHEADLSIDLAALAGAAPGPIALSPAQPFALAGLRLRLHLQPGIWYTIGFTPGPHGLPALSPDLPAPAQQQGWYILAVGHNVLPPILKTWLALGGVPVAGAPLDEAQPMAGGTVQYFDSVAMQARRGTVSLLPLGLAAIGGKPYPAARELPKKQRHLYFPATGHNLRAHFLDYWRANGGAAIWGLPVSEEIARGALTMQYFANAEFVWNGSSISLGPLGDRAWAHRLGNPGL